jgi:hypothetical protein
VGFVLLPITNIKFADKVDLGNVLGAVATLIVAVLINQVFARHVSRASTDTALLLDHLAEIRTTMKRLEKASENARSGKKLSKTECLVVNTAERDLSNSVHSLEHALDCCGIQKGKLCFDALKKRRLNVKKALTDSPYPGPYNTKQQNAISNAFKLLNDEVTRITFDVHRMSA